MPLPNSSEALREIADAAVGSEPNASFPVSQLNEHFLRADLDTQISIILEEYRAAYDLQKAGALDAYSGEFVAFLNGRVVGVGPDAYDLRTNISSELGVDPERLAILHVFDEVVL